MWAPIHVSVASKIRRTHVDALLPPIIAAVRGWGVEKRSQRRSVAADVPHAIVNDYPQAARDPHVAEVDGVAWQTLAGLPGIAVRKRSR